MLNHVTNDSNAPGTEVRMRLRSARARALMPAGDALRHAGRRSWVVCALGSLLLLGCGTSESSSDGSTPSVPLGEPQQGIATYYDFADGSGACMFDPTPDDLDVAALNAEQFAIAAYCGACARVEGQSGSVTVRLVDLCPECRAGHLDLSPSAFAQLAPLELGRVDITWTLTECAVSGPIEYRYKDGANEWWTAVQVRNHRYPIAKFEVDKGNGFGELRRTDYNYFLDESGFGSDGVTVRVTTSTGQVLVDDLPPVQAELVVAGHAQFE